MPISRSNSKTLGVMLIATVIAYLTLGFIANSELSVTSVKAQEAGRVIGK